MSIDLAIAPIIDKLIDAEGRAYTTHPNDRGGPTKFGITCYDLAQHLHESMNSMSAWAPRVKAMTLAVAGEIYKKKYATACRFDVLNSGCDCVVFDFGVNSGPSRAVKFAQVVAGAVSDGIMGPQTIGHINGMDPATFINKLCDIRMAFLRRLGTWGTFGRGWTARVRDLRSYSLSLVAPDLTVAGYPQPQHKETRIPKAFAKAEPEEDTA